MNSYNESAPTGCSFWDNDDISPCIRKSLLDSYLPAAIVVGSLLYLLLIGAQQIKTHRKLYAKDETQPLLEPANGSPTDYSNTYGTIDYEEEQSTAELTTSQKHFDISRLEPLKDDGTPLGLVKYVQRDGWEKVKLILEFVILIFQLVIAVVALFVPSLNQEWEGYKLTPIVRVFVWIFLFALGSIRALNKSGPFPLANISLLYYIVNIVPSALSFRSVLIHPQNSQLVNYYYSFQFINNTLLFLLLGSARVFDHPSVLFDTDDGVKPSPENNSNFFEIVTYSWIDPLIFKAYKTPLQFNDIWGLRIDDYAYFLLRRFKDLGFTRTFTYKIFYFSKGDLAAQALWASIDSMLIFGPSLLLKRILEYVDNPGMTSRNMAWLYVLTMFFIQISDSLVSGRSLYLGRRVCIRMKALIIGEVYAKALRRRMTSPEELIEEVDPKDGKAPIADQTSKEESKSTELGGIINLMAVDASKVSELCSYLHFFVNSFFMIIVAVTLLYRLLGWSALAGSSSILILLPLNYKLASKIGEFQKEMLGITDNRIQKLNEAFQSIRIIKFFAWEENFAKEIMKVRNEEIRYLRYRVIVWTCSAFVWFITPTLVTLISFYFYVVFQGKILTTPVAFTALSLFNLLRSPLDQLSDMLSFMVQSKVSLDRVQKFLEEQESDKYEQLTHTRGANSPEVGFENATLSWNKGSKNDFQLKDIDIAFKVGKLNVIIGPTGSGKTSLLLGLLGEMQLTNGKIFLPGSTPRDELIPNPETGMTEAVAYCSQIAWLLNDTVKNNIVFAAPFNQQRYDAVIDACGLTRDLKVLDAGDATEIGEKGITLSGGQKQRVSLARALYSNARHVLLDDCLSAVDSHTAAWIYENCITGPLMKDRTCILVSHNVALTVRDAAWIVAMDNGRVLEQGTCEDLLSSGSLGHDDLVSTVISSRSQSSVNLKQLNVSDTSEIHQKLKKIAESDKADQLDEERLSPRGKLIEDETKSSGAVSWEVYKFYGRAFGGVFIWFVFVAAFAASQGSNIMQSVWLKIWAAANDKLVSPAFTMSIDRSLNALKEGFRASVASVEWSRPLGGEMFRVYGEESSHSSGYYITIYALIGLSYALISAFRVYVVFMGGIVASNKIFEDMLTKIFNAKLRFFDSTPIGRIMNRFSKDTESIDQELAPYAEGFIVSVLQCGATILLICIITPGFIVFAAFIVIIYYYIGALYLASSRELKRYDSITVSPIHQHFSETLVGVTTIRAYGDERRFMRQNLEKIDNNNRSFFYLWVANRWLALRVDFVGALVSLLSAAFVMLSIGHIDAGMAGLSLSYAIAFTQSALWVVRLYSVVEMNMNSVERLEEYLNIDQEPDREIPDNKPPSSWPETGEIEVDDVSLRYAPSLPKVIKNVSFKVEPRSKIGIVGRTGAGKSTIITAFFRFVDPESGSIKIDGIDITSIGLKDLRNAVTIIPQDPTLFTGTIRSNLDPFNQYSDAEIFESLKRVNLVSTDEPTSGSSSDNIEDSNENVNKFLNLNNTVSEGGSNLSQGQRQLTCLARSLLKSPKIILLDEATASIDYNTDSKIQTTIREEFSDSTILTIAHRLRSIIDYDKILVMDAGRVVEYDDPYKLISDQNSLFYSMCSNSGELDTLVKLAKEAFIAKRNKK
ncbi:Transporter of the ATP-binding cassette (ABC) family [Komagataella phaffii CBS 7435]|uniref:Transporter of the ATP-binding cassette (ABC) family involved in bile acid transport n=2 Tax=Komagataella phaffii TaxID=460519 RepID=C4QWG7_KOMPG|nr:Transporter of the ATP-binding cassette (ABC) family involved in bile acid transport [Komagataella phaffii GS115]AOA61209.1 GQ67_02803T0 [Komagataella phaffii]CAH2446262.1 Transporter of the ATP-binding cassette (ABC) family [Komagataella phaffii CBS 7435]AOA65757.1 GQ68_02445T0 [Komagataella phaffii GS115]CAY67590.1 Transporter of the ATP-binding cassette (ABC) family involved in bile acid transport [Komagataella phaffii GS115]CCA36685.1 Transporter of the ATP-binding cassette (ABC) family